MARVLLTGFGLHLAKPKRKPVFKRESSNLVCGTVIEVADNVFRVSVEINDKQEILDFTPESYSLKERTSFFTKAKDKLGKRTRIIRDVSQIPLNPNFSSFYIPFNKNWIVKGYIVKNGFIRLFDFKSLVNIKGYVEYEYSPNK